MSCHVPSVYSRHKHPIGFNVTWIFVHRLQSTTYSSRCKVFFGHSKEAATGRQTVDRFSARNFVFYSHTRSTFWLRQEYIATINLVPFLTVDTGDVCHPAGFFGTGALVHVSGASISAKFWVMLFELDSVSPEYPGEQRKFPPCLPPFDFGIW